MATEGPQSAIVTDSENLHSTLVTVPVTSIGLL
jgi:hypothetical protein